MATTPPSLFGTLRRIAYNHRKYHSGLICKGVDNGLAGIKFSGSPRMKGENNTMIEKNNRMKENPIASLIIKYGCIVTLVLPDSTPIGLFLPVW